MGRPVGSLREETTEAVSWSRVRGRGCEEKEVDGGDAVEKDSMPLTTSRVV